MLDDRKKTIESRANGKGRSAAVIEGMMLEIERLKQALQLAEQRIGDFRHSEGLGYI